MCESSTATSIARPPAASVETIPSRWGFQTFLIPIVGTLAVVAVVLGVINGPLIKVANAAALQAGTASNPPANAAGDLYKQGTSLEASGKLLEAASSYQASCDSGDAAGCTRLGDMYMESRGVVKDVKRALQLFQKGCDAGDAEGCGNLGIMYANGMGVTRAGSRAAQLYSRGCDGGNAAGCINLGVMYSDGVGVAKDDNRAVQLYQKGCDGGDAPGCSKLGFMYENGL
jgi:TPR repeat protein